MHKGQWIEIESRMQIICEYSSHKTQEHDHVKKKYRFNWFNHLLSNKPSNDLKIFDTYCILHT